MDLLVTTIQSWGKGVVNHGTSSPKICLFNCSFKICGLYVLGSTDAGREFYSCAVRIVNDNEKSLERLKGISTK